MSFGRYLRWSRQDGNKTQAHVDVAVGVTDEQRSDEQSLSRQSQEHGDPSQALARELHAVQIFMIALSGIIGITIFATMGQFLRTAGPAGLLLAIVYVGATAICVMEGLGELVVQWPVSNAMVQYVKEFVDPELSVVVGFVYWYTWSSVVATMVVGAANFSQYWGFSRTGYVSVFYIVSPICMVVINWFGVFTFGVVETIGGILKFLFVLAGAIFMIVEGALRFHSTKINEGFQNDPDIASTHLSAIILIIPFLTYGFLGVEIVSVTAFEAKHPRTSLRVSARLIAWTVALLFLLSGVGATLNFHWTDRDLSRLVTREAERSTDLRNSSFLVTATNNAGYPRLAGFFNASLIFGCLSAGNTGLYVASRVLHALAQQRETPSKKGRTWLTKLNRNSVPIWALIVSAVSWCWLPFLQLKQGYPVESVFTVLITIGSVGTVLVWASQCLAYMRYYYWLRLHQNSLTTLRGQDANYWRKYDRWMKQNPDRYYSILSELQPAVAYFGFASSLLIVFVYSTATWWEGGFKARKFFVAYGGPLLCLLIWLCLKMVRGSTRLWVKLEKKEADFKDLIGKFEEQLYLRDPEEEILMQPPRATTMQVLQQDNSARSPMTPEGPFNNRIIARPNEVEATAQAGTGIELDPPLSSRPSHLSLSGEASPIEIQSIGGIQPQSSARSPVQHTRSRFQINDRY